MGIARLDLATWVAAVVGLAAVFAIKFVVGPGGSIWYAVWTAMATAPLYLWAVMGHWDCNMRLPVLVSLAGVAAVFLAAETALASVNDGDAVPVMIGTCTVVSVRILVSCMVRSPMFSRDLDKID
jgi:hypothetical protein